METLLDAFGVDWKLLLAQAVNFGVLLVVLWLVLYKPVMKTLDERAKKIAQGVEDAERASQKLASADDEAANIVAKADVNASTIVTSARTSALEEKARIVKEAEERAARLEKDAQARAKEEAARALRDSEREVARLSILAAEKVLTKRT
ncbi:F0F1 ATP synthase subunit B [Candidatus Parcubacteria bacterium]|nr:F0F1 ATP synthase subunit B [Candidatus Parcubacteria bacterium]